MISLEETRVKSTEDLPEIYCDMDQVLCNFMKAADAAVNGIFVTTDRVARWEMISQTKGFWENLEWMPGARKLYQRIAKYDTHILSGFSIKTKNSKSGKMKWLQKNTNIKRGKIHLVAREQKQAYAQTNGKSNVLIDDYIKNIREWEAKGGIGVHHTDVSKTLSELSRLGYK